MIKTPDFESCFADLIAIPSVSSIDPAHDQSNQQVIDALANWFHGLGFACEIVAVSQNPDKFNLIATLGSVEQRSGLVLSGHTDTVPFDESGWDTDPFKLTSKDENYYGLGTADMKSFFPIILEALKRIEIAKLKKRLTIVATADEESTMNGARILTRESVKGDYCIIGEPTGLNPIHSHKGIIIESFKLTGRSGHSSNPAFGNSAMEGMHMVMTSLMQWRTELQASFYDDSFKVPVPTMNFGRIHGGDSPNRICAECELSLDLRVMPGMDTTELQKSLKERIQDALDNTGLKLDFTSKVLPVPPMHTDMHSEIVKHSETLTGHHSACVTYCTEGPFFNDMGMETVILGPGDIDVAHQPNEYLQQERIEPMIDVLSKLIMQFCGK